MNKRIITIVYIEILDLKKKLTLSNLKSVNLTQETHIKNFLIYIQILNIST